MWDQQVDSLASEEKVDSLVRDDVGVVNEDSGVGE